MKNLKLETLRKMVVEGRVELLTDISKAGRAELRWTRTDKRETVTIKAPTTIQGWLTSLIGGAK